MLASFSTEKRILDEAEALNCAINNLAVISGAVSKSRLAQALAGTNDLERRDAELILIVLREMKELQELSQTPCDWKQTDCIREALEQRRQAKTLLADVTRVVNEMHRVNKVLRGQSDDI